MPFHRVEQGECLATIADLFRVGSWQVLRDHPQNAALMKVRRDPNILLPGDKVFVPDPQEKEGKTVARATGQAHAFKLKARLAGLRVVLKDIDGTPFRGKRFVVTVGDHDIEGVTGDDGLVEVSVPVAARRATLRAWLYDYEDHPEDPEDPDMEYHLLIGHLDPHDTVSGVQARLQNLGFRVEVDGVLGDETRLAIQHFRQKHGVKPEGSAPIDATLCEALRKQHQGC